MVSIAGRDLVRTLPRRTPGLPSIRVRSGETGLSLVEVLVSITILSMTMVLALTLYDDARRSFKSGENAVEQQQTVRVAFDTISSDLRMAGFNHNPDGAEFRPDEQIEAAFDNAVVIRADFDAEDPVASAVPETALSGLAFATVSTGNDEIVAFVLGKEGVNPDELIFEADISSPRDGIVDTVRIPKADLTPDDPPYILYRVTFDADGNAVPVPLADNMRSLDFSYFDHAGVRRPPVGGADTVNEVATRRVIRRIGVSLEGLTRDPDLFYEDGDDPDPDTRDHRKYALSADVALRNVGRIGIADLNSDLTAPLPPNWPPGGGGGGPVVAGHCAGLLIDWDANPPADDVEYYRVMYGTTPDTPEISLPTVNDDFYLDGLVDTTQYYLRVMAVDSNGNVSTPSGSVTQTTAENTPPAAPEFVVATSNPEGWIDLTWDEVTANTQPLIGDPLSPKIRDLVGYRVYRRVDLNAPFSDADLIADETSLPALPTPSFTDTNVVACQEYHYLLESTDGCGTRGTALSSVSAVYGTSIKPRAPEFVEARVLPGLVHVTWHPVTEDMTGTPIEILNYTVDRTDYLNPGAPPLAYPHSFAVAVSAGSPPKFIDSITIPAGKTVFYRVTAHNKCVGGASLPSLDAEAGCFQGSVVFTSPGEGALAAPPATIGVNVTGAGPLQQLVLEFYNEDTGILDPGITCSGTAPATPCILNGAGKWLYYDWVNEPLANYTIRATVTDDNFCNCIIEVHVGPGPGGHDD